MWMTTQAILVGLLVLSPPMQRSGGGAVPGRTVSTPDTESSAFEHDHAFVQAYRAYAKNRFRETLGLLAPLNEVTGYWLRDYLLHLQARSHERMGEWPHAAAFYEKLQTEFPDFIFKDSNRRAMANAYYQSDHRRKADSLYHQLLEDPGSSRPTYLYRLFKLHASGAIDEPAIPLAVELYRDYPQRHESDLARDEVAKNRTLEREFAKRWTLRDSITRVDTLVREKETTRALREIQTLLRTAKSLDRSQKQYLELKKGQVLLAGGKTDEAIRAFQPLLGTEFLAHEARLGLARAYLEKKQYARAKKELWTLLNQPASGEMKARAAEELVSAVKKAPERDDELPELYIRLANDPDVRDRNMEYRWRAALEAARAGQFAHARDLLLEIRGPAQNWWMPAAIAYWLGRVHELLGEKNMQTYFYGEVLAKYPFSYYAYLVGRDPDGVRAASLSGPDRPRVVGTRRGGTADASCYANQSPVTISYLERANRMARLGLDDLARMELQGLLAQKDDPSAMYSGYRDLTGLKDYAVVISDGRKRFSVPLEPQILPCDGLWPLLYPRGYRQFVSYMAEKQKVDDNLVYGLIREESTFNPNITSPANAHGLMQIIPSTARIIQKQTGMTFMNRRDLFDPYFNVKLGVTHFRDLLDMFDGSPVLALAAYNAGPGNVRRWLGERSYRDDAEFAEFIPYKETHGYVKKVLSAYQVYNWLYRGDESVVTYD